MATAHFIVKEHIIDASYIREYPRALANNQEDILKLKIKQYLPKQPCRHSKKVTIIGTHANGFPKELYEPFWDEIYAQCSANGFDIGSIWMADVAWQGESSVLNEDLLGNDPSWHDHTRDLLHMVNMFRHEMPRPLIGIGHSMGGVHILNLALIHPRLFTGLILLDPTISNGNNRGNGSGNASQYAWQSTYRRDTWPSREAAAKSFRNSPFYQLWDPRVLDLWIEYGLRNCPTVIYPDKVDANSPPVTLTTPKSQEVWTFLRPNYTGQGRDHQPVKNRTTYSDLDPDCDSVVPFYRPEIRAAYLKLPHLKPATFFIQGGQSNLGSKEEQYAVVPQTGVGVGGSGGVKVGNVDHVFLEGVGHLVPLENPVKTAEAAVDWIMKRLDIWYSEEEDFQKSWSKTTKQDKTAIDKDWLDHIGPPPQRFKSKPKL